MSTNLLFILKLCSCSKPAEGLVLIIYSQIMSYQETRKQATLQNSHLQLYNSVVHKSNLDMFRIIKLPG